MKESLCLWEGGEVHAFGARTLRLTCFRNYRSTEVSFHPGLNLITGANAQGKTNLLEALYLLSTSRLLRGQRDAEAILDGEDRFAVEARLANGSTDLKVTLERGSRKRSFLNGIAFPRASDLLGRLPCVCISSLDMETVRGEPSERRLFLDLELSALSTRYLQHFAQYRRSLEQRNALLKTAREHPVEASAFEVWEAALAEHGAILRTLRGEYVAQLQPILAQFQSELGQGESLEAKIVRADPAEDQEQFIRLLWESRPQEIARGSTSVGPHRDDLALSLDGSPVRLFGSQGQQRSTAISLKLAAMKVIQDRLGAPPLLLLDDIFSDLDSRRRETLVEIVADHAGQTVLTCTESSLAGPKILGQAKLFTVERGTVRQE